MNELLNQLRYFFKSKAVENPNLAFWISSEADVHNTLFKNAMVGTAQSMCKRKFNIGEKLKLYNNSLFIVYSYTPIT